VFQVISTSFPLVPLAVALQGLLAPYCVSTHLGFAGFPSSSSSMSKKLIAPSAGSSSEAMQQ
jgi:hypothetical protein